MIELIITFKEGKPATYLLPDWAIIDWTNVEHAQIDRIVVRKLDD